ncbi:MAG: hypothetical protein VZR53_12165, partial [Prevotella sp.]|nr:hypothetical protein [Prevotella sp.]
MADVSKIKLPNGTTYNIKDTISGYITANMAPVTSVNGDTGDVTITEGLEPLIGTTSTVTPQQVMIALEEGRDICITATASVLIAIVPIDMSVKFTAFTRVTDIPNSGQGIDVVVSQAIVKYGNAYAVIDLYGGIIGGESKAWTADSNYLATSDALELVQSNIPASTSQLTNDSGFITNETETDPTVPSWAKESTKPTYTASEVGAIPGNVGGVFYGTCSTAAGTVAKVVECADFTADNLKAGAIIIVSFTATNSGAVANLTMNVNGTGAKHIKYINNGSLGNLLSAGHLKENTEYPFYYDG